MDKYLLWHQLSLIQQLNCVCDTLAKQSVNLAMTQGYHDRPTHLLPKDPWLNKQFDEVDWEHLDLALKTKTDMYKIWRSKQTSGFCGTRVQVG